MLVLEGSVAIQSGDLTVINRIVANTEGELNCGFKYTSMETGLLSIDSSSIIEGDVAIESSGCDALRTGDPGLLGLADNGGALTHALSVNSIARNSSDTACLLTDQAGQIRDISDGFCDVGALEFNADFSTVESPYIIRLPNGKTVMFNL